MTEAGFLCSSAARGRLDPLVGTAAPASRWLLVEHQGPWHRDALTSVGLVPSVLTELREAASSTAARILLIRRPGRRAPGPGRAWAVVDSAAPSSAPVWGTWDHDGDLLAAASVLRDGVPATGYPGEPLLLVCAHGRHDTCCAVRGRPVAVALQQRWPETTWECSHVGGDRFAANLVVLPDGAFYGGLDPASAVEVVSRHRGGVPSPEHLRGISTEPPVAQAAIVEALRRHPTAHVRSFASTVVRQSGPQRWAVRLAGSGALPDLDVEVATSAREPARLTCSGLRSAVATRYDVLSVEVRAPAR